MKKKIILVLVTTMVTAFVAGCGSAQSHGETTVHDEDKQETTENVTEKVTENATENVTEKATEKVTEASLSETELLTIMEKECQNTIINHIYLDMDNDGGSELIGIYSDSDTGIHNVWYCSSDGSVCKKVTENTVFFDESSVGIIKYDKESHVIVNYYNLMGDSKQFTILALKDNEITLPALNALGYAEQDETGSILVIADAYDGFYDAAIGALIGHTWKNAYIFYDEQTKSYKEYGATAITEETFRQYENADETMNDIKHEMSLTQTGTVEYKYYLRSNGILEIQCIDKSASNDITYSYFSAPCSDGKITDKIAEPCSGQVETAYTGLEAVY